MTKIPLCRSSLLQDVTIALGRRSLKSVRYQNRTLEFEVAEDETEGAAIERLNIESRGLLQRMTKVTIWEDGIAWIYYRKPKTKASPPSAFKTHASFAGMDPEAVAELIRSTLRDPESTLEFWRSHAIS